MDDSHEDALAGLPRQPSRGRLIGSRLGRLLFALLAALLLLGFVGHGPVSWSTAQSGDLTVRYERFSRHGAPWTLTVEAPATDGQLAVVVDRQFHESLQVESITPQPAEVAVDGELVRYSFMSASPGSVTVDFHVRSDSLWSQHATVGVANGSQTDFGLFFYP